MKKSLQSSEWILVGSLLLIMSSLVVIAKINTYKTRSTLAEQQLEIAEQVEVEVMGEVANPGIYRVSSGMELKEILKKAKPKPHADLDGFAKDEKITASRQVKIEKLKEIVVEIQGAVLEPIQLRIPVHTRVCDLKSKVQLTGDADRRFLLRKRELKNGEILVVPKKSIE